VAVGVPVGVAVGVGVCVAVGVAGVVGIAVAVAVGVGVGVAVGVGVGAAAQYLPPESKKLIEPGVSTPDEHLAVSPYRSVFRSGIRRVSGACGSPAIGAWTVSSAGGFFFIDNTCL